jgi:hypothetical protein
MLQLKLITKGLADRQAAANHTFLVAGIYIFDYNCVADSISYPMAL